jgi:hypothetical protein
LSLAHEKGQCAAIARPFAVFPDLEPITDVLSRLQE